MEDPSWKGGLGSRLELEHLKDSIPAAQASKALYGETSMDGASGVLNKHYSNPDLRANKLKLQLKNIKPKFRPSSKVFLFTVLTPLDSWTFSGRNKKKIKK